MYRIPARPIRKQLFRARPVDPDILPFITMKFLSDKQEQTVDKNEFLEKYGFLFRDYELMSNILEKHEQKDNTYISDIKSSIIALKNSQNIYIKEIYSKINEDKFTNDFLKKTLDIINTDTNLFNYAIEFKQMESRIDLMYMPMKLPQLIAKLASANHTVSQVYDPTCREASIITSLEKFDKAVLYEKDETTYIQAIMNLIVNEMPMEKIQIQNREIIIDPDNTRYDTILSIGYPQIRQSKLFENLDTGRYDKYKNRNPNTLHLLNIIDHLNENGLLITTVTQDILVRKDSLPLRQCLIENNLLDAVIEYNAGLREEIILLIINKNKKTDDVLFIKKTIRRMNNIDEAHEEVVDCYKNRKIIKRSSNILSMEEIIENDYKILPKRYVYTLDYMSPDINEVKREQKNYTEQIRKLDEEISHLLEDLKE